MATMRDYSAGRIGCVSAVIACECDGLNGPGGSPLLFPGDLDSFDPSVAPRGFFTPNLGAGFQRPAVKGSAVPAVAWPGSISSRSQKTKKSIPWQPTGHYINGNGRSIWQRRSRSRLHVAADPAALGT